MSNHSKEEFRIAPGNIISIPEKDPLHPPKYRIIYLTEDSAYLCKMKTSRLDITMIGVSSLNQLLLDRKIIVSEPDQIVIDVSVLSDSVQKAYQRNRDIVQRISQIYGPDFMELQTRKPKPIYTELSEQYQISTVTLRHIMRQYLQGGMVLSALIDERHFPHKRGTEHLHSKRNPGENLPIFPAAKY